MVSVSMVFEYHLFYLHNSTDTYLVLYISLSKFMDILKGIWIL